MASLKKTGDRFEVLLKVIEGGSGMFRGVIGEADQKQIPIYAFVNNRRVLRTKPGSPVKAGMVIQAPSGERFIVGSNGASDQTEGTLWMSWRLFQATGQIEWKRRKKKMDLVTRQERDDGFEPMGMIWAAIEPLDREVGDFRMSASFEQVRIICGQDIKHDDLVDGRKVTRADKTLGVIIGVLT